MLARNRTSHTQLHTQHKSFESVLVFSMSVLMRFRHEFRTLKTQKKSQLRFLNSLLHFWEKIQSMVLAECLRYVFIKSLIWIQSVNYRVPQNVKPKKNFFFIYIFRHFLYNFLFVLNFTFDIML